MRKLRACAVILSTTNGGCPGRTSRRVPAIDGLPRQQQQAKLPYDHHERVLGVVVFQQPVEELGGEAGIALADRIDHGEDLAFSVEC